MDKNKCPKKNPKKTFPKDFSRFSFICRGGNFPKKHEL